MVGSLSMGRGVVGRGPARSFQRHPGSRITHRETPDLGGSRDSVFLTCSQVMPDLRGWGDASQPTSRASQEGRRVRPAIPGGWEKGHRERDGGRQG